jgi:hypothetical protein
VFIILKRRTTMADTIISTDGLTNLNTSIQDAKYETTIRDYQNKDYLSDKLTQLNSNNEARADHTNDKISELNDFNVQRGEFTNNKISDADWKAEARATRGVDELLAESRFLDLGAARRDDAAKLAASNNAFGAAAQADRVAQAATAQITATAAAATLQAYNNTNRLDSMVDNARSEGRDAATAAVLATYVTRDLIRSEADETRKLMNTHYTEELRDKINLQHQELVELRFDCKSRDRDYNQLNQNFLQSQMTSQLNALNSQIQQVHQATTNRNISFGSGAVTGGATTSNVA